MVPAIATSVRRVDRAEERAERDGEHGEGDRHHVALVEVEPQGPR